MSGRLTKLRQLVDDAREKLARQDFDAATVLGTVSAAAVAGFGSVTIRPSLPLNISRTKAVKVLTDWLDREGLRWEWVPFHVDAKAVGNITGEPLDVPELRIWWLELELGLPA